MNIYGTGDDKKIFDNYRVDDNNSRLLAMSLAIKDHFKPKKILDIGCAKGFLVKSFNDNGIDSFGVDVSEYAISNAPEDIRHKLYKTDLNTDELPFQDESFDFVTLIWTIQYLSNYQNGIKEINRVLKNGGYVLVSKAPKKRIATKIKTHNVYKEKFLINEFEANGFKFARKDLIDFKIMNINYLLHQGNTFKSKLGKKFYQAGFIGQVLVFWVHKLLNLHVDRVYGEYIFRKVN